MSHSSYSSSLLSLGLAAVAALSLGAFGCASAPPPPAAAAAPPSNAFQMAAGVAAPQGNPDDSVQFVEQEHKDPTIQGDGPATQLNPGASAKPKQ